MIGQQVKKCAHSLHGLTITSVCQCVGSNMSSLSVLPPQCLLQPLIVPKRLMLGPGPSNVPARISAAGAQPMLGHLHAETIEVTQYMCTHIILAYRDSSPKQFKFDHHTYPHAVRCMTFILVIQC